MGGPHGSDFIKVEGTASKPWALLPEEYGKPKIGGGQEGGSEKKRGEQD